MLFEAESDPETPNNNALIFNDVVPRRSVNFQPNAWGDFFLSCNSNTLEEDDELKKHLSELKRQVRNMLANAGNSSKKLRLIDSIQRLGLAYHFKGEINEILEHIFQNACNIVDPDEDLFIVALKFRLLRQQGYFVSSEIFNKFIDEMGTFKKSIVKDERGLLSLYEASHLRMKRETIMDEALAFTTIHLQEITLNSNSCFGEEVKYALTWPIFKTFPRLMSKNYISLYHNQPLHNNVLLTFAKLDYNNLQKLHQREVAELSRWQKDLRSKEQLSFARDRIVECHVWALGVYYEPKYSRFRILLAKFISLILFIDDMYDVYATLDELEPFTNAIERWDINDIEKLPNYMKVLYEAIFDVYRDIEQADICKDNNISYVLDYTKEEMKRLCKAFLVEAKWFHEGYVPTMEEYMKVAIVSSTYYFFGSMSLLSMGDVASKEVFEWAKNDPMILKAVAVIGRLMNDMNSHKFEQERGHVASAVECYMNQYGELEEVVVAELKQQVVKAWKDLTEGYIQSNEVPNIILERILNIARATYLFYREEDGFTLVDGATKHFITSMLVDPC